MLDLFAEYRNQVHQYSDEKEQILESWHEYCMEELSTGLSKIPSGLSVNELELAIVISNLLENAINDCRKLPETERYVKLTAKYKNQLLLEIENSCDRKVIFDEDGYPFFREEDHGIGTRSVVAFVNKTDSEICYLTDETRFRVRMII